jgi:hypothetical protein
MAGTKYPEFDIPDSFIVPEGVAEGETFEALGTFKLKANGKACLTKIDQAPIYADDKQEEPDDYGTKEGMSNRLSEAYKNRA